MPVNLNEIDFLCAEFKIKQIIFQLTLFSSQLLLRLVMTPISSLVHFRHFNLVAGRLDSSHKWKFWRNPRKRCQIFSPNVMAKVFRGCIFQKISTEIAEVHDFKPAKVLERAHLDQLDDQAEVDWSKLTSKAAYL